MSDKKVHLKIDRQSSSVTLEEILKEIARIQDENPDLEVYFDGDEYAICSKQRQARPADARPARKPTTQSPIDMVGEADEPASRSAAPTPPKARKGRKPGKGHQGALATLDDG